jgi:hypothetical protein
MTASRTAFLLPDFFITATYRYPLNNLDPVAGCDPTLAKADGMAATDGECKSAVGPGYLLSVPLRSSDAAGRAFAGEPTREVPANSVDLPQLDRLKAPAGCAAAVGSATCCSFNPPLIIARIVVRSAGETGSQ